MIAVRFVGESDLPVGHDWVVGQTDDGDAFLFIKEGAVVPSHIEEAWHGYRLLSAGRLHRAA